MGTDPNFPVENLSNRLAFFKRLEESALSLLSKRVYMIPLAIVVLIVVIVRFGPYVLVDTKPLETQLVGEWQADFPVDAEIKNVWQTNSLKLTFYADRTCDLYLESENSSSTFEVSDDGRSRSSGTGHSSIKSDIRGEYRLTPGWNEIYLTLTLNGRYFYSSSFEPFRVVQKPNRDFTDPRSKIKIRAVVRLQEDVLLLKGKGGREVGFLPRGMVFNNQTPLVRSGAASGEGRYLIKRPLRRQRKVLREEEYQEYRPN